MVIFESQHFYPRSNQAKLHFLPFIWINMLISVIEMIEMLVEGFELPWRQGYTAGGKHMTGSILT